MSNANGRIVCIGAATRDCRARALAPIIRGSSNPVERRFASGGVARNVAEGLARLGAPTALVSRVGRDAAGERIVADLLGLGVDLSGVGRSSEHPTAEYAALIAPDGEMFVAFADMAIFDELLPARVLPVLDSLGDAGIWFADANLPGETIAALGATRPAEVRLAVDPVSVAKSARLRPILSSIDILFANRQEAAALAGDGSVEGDLRQAARRLVEAGVGRVVVAAGAAGALVATPAEVAMLPASPAAIVDVTGAGDALAAGTLRGLTAGMDLNDAVRLGLSAAAFAVESVLPVPREMTYAGVVDRSSAEGAAAT